MVLNREEFVAAMARRFGPIYDPMNDAHVMWAGEKHTMVRCEFFVNIHPIRISALGGAYWDWVDENVVGMVSCYSSDSVNNEEWWGFTDADSIAVWLLRWA